MIYPMKVKDKDGNLKYEVSQRDCLVSFWKSLGDGLYNEFTGAEIQPEQRGNKLKRVTCVREGCSIEFQKHNAMHKYCSAKCTRDASNARHSAKMVADRKPTYCRKCNKEFQPESNATAITHARHNTTQR